MWALNYHSNSVFLLWFKIKELSKLYSWKTHYSQSAHKNTENSFQFSSDLCICCKVKCHHRVLTNTEKPVFWKTSEAVVKLLCKLFLQTSKGSLLCFFFFFQSRRQKTNQGMLDPIFNTLSSLLVFTIGHRERCLYLQGNI